MARERCGFGHRQLGIQAGWRGKCRRVRLGCKDRFRRPGFYAEAFPSSTSRSGSPDPGKHNCHVTIVVENRTALANEGVEEAAEVEATEE